jgi:hypothetical protein
VREGFLRSAARRAEGDDGRDVATDSRLLMQIGMAFALLYVGFLVTWFWATRMRWRR